MTNRFKRSATAAASLLLIAVAATGCSAKGATAIPISNPDNPTVAFISAPTGDFSVLDSSYAGFEDAKKSYDFNPLELLSTQTDDYKDRVELAISRKSDLAIGVGYQYVEPMTGTTDTGDTYLAAIDVDWGTTIPGATTISFAANQSSYLVGVAAALTSKTSHIGFVGGVDMPLIQDFFVGFQAGAKSIDPDIVVDSTYLSPFGDFNGFEDPTKGNEAAVSMYSGGADVVYAAAGASGQGVYEAAASESTSEVKDWAIGVDGDVYSQVDKSIKPYILTSAIKNVGVAVSDTIGAFIDGTLKPGEQHYDLSNDGVGYATSGGYVDAISDQLEKARQAIIDGTLVVPTALS